jgi:ribulose-bisphosphate carboxylase large chain
VPPTRIEADYLIETAYPAAAAAEAMAGEQSSGTFVPVPGETPELKLRAAARVERLDVIGDQPMASLPGSASPSSGGERIQARVTLSWPIDNLGPSLPNLLATVAGNLFELKQLSGLRLLDIRLPPAFADAYPGPQFGIEGTRRLADVHGRPLIGTIIKPSVGLNAEETASLVATLAAAGIDFIKDDELQSDGPYCPFELRARAVMRVINEHAERSGKKVMYAFNLTGDLDQMRHRHDLVRGLGGTSVMASLNSVGLAGIIELRRHAELVLHAHRNGWGYLSRHPLLGWSFVAWQKIWRIAGVDHLHVNGLRNKFSEADESVIESARACLAPLFDAKPFTVMPVFSSGQTVVQPPDTYRALGSVDLIYAAGGGIMAHPHGPGAGVRSLKEAWDAAIAGIAPADYARDHPALAAALGEAR